MQMDTVYTFVVENNKFIMFYYIESVGSELCGAMARQTSVLSCPISGLVPAELAPGRKNLARRNDGAIPGAPP